MIQIPNTSISDLNIFENKNVIIYGSGIKAQEIYKIFTSNNIKVIAIYSERNRDILCSMFSGLIVTDLKKIKKICSSMNNIIVQFIVSDSSDISDKIDMFNKWGAEVSNLSSGSMLTYFLPKLILAEYDTTVKNKILRMLWKHKCLEKNEISVRRFRRLKITEPIILCLPPKTADHTLKITFDKINECSQDEIQNELYKRLSSFNDKFLKSNRLVTLLIEPYRYLKQIEFINFWHRPRYFEKLQYMKQYKKIKIITAVRDPIAQNLSALYHGIGAEDWIYGELENIVGLEKEKKKRYLEDIFVDNAGDMQKLFEAFIRRFVYTENNVKKNARHARSIQHFLPEFNENILNIYEYPFDKNKGFGIMRDGNIEVFVYQLEKLNDIIPELSEWIGKSFECLEKGNIGVEKWSGEAYKQAQNKIKISQEYFEKCYQETYVKKFYTEEDIKKFKEKWYSHIEI